MCLQGRRYPGGHCREGGTLSESLWERLGPAHTSELSLEIQVTSKDSAGRKLNRKVSLVPENEKHPSSSPP